TSDLTYERLEFLGDAYIELFASRLIYESYSHLPAGRMSQVRELLVKNETLAELSRRYGFDQNIAVGAEIGELLRDSRGRGNKGYNKIVGDVFEAYVAAVVLSDFEGRGFEKAEGWCRDLWEAKLE
ncbi:Ribonuclease_3-domain-containing protein, partial [Sphaerulina musiva SO2202]